MLTIRVEHTDTFAGQPNYCWVRRHEFVADESASRRTLVMKTKELCGLTGHRCDVTECGDDITITPHGVHEIVLVTCHPLDFVPALPYTHKPT